jgi:hypothetical protein
MDELARLDTMLYMHETCEGIAAYAVDILAQGLYSSVQMDDMKRDLEAITDGCVQVRQEEVPQRD